MGEGEVWKAPWLESVKGLLTVPVEAAASPAANTCVSIC